MKRLAVLALLPFLATKPARALEREAPSQTPVDAPNSVGARLGVEGTPLASLYYARFGRGLWRERAETELVFTSAVLTGFDGARLRLERREPLLCVRHYTLLALLGVGAAVAHDEGGSYQSVAGLVGVQGTRAVGRWELGVRLAYLPTIATHVKLSEDARDTYRDRYPDARGEAGPRDATLWLPGQRLQALLGARALWPAWVFDASLGLQLSPLAGRDATNLDLGQLPLFLQIGLGRRF